MQRASSLFQDPKKRESLAFLVDYDISNPPPLSLLPDQIPKSKHKKSSFASSSLKSAYSTFDLKGSLSSVRESKSFAPSRSISMSHLSTISNPMATPMSKRGSVYPNQIMETPKLTGMVDTRPVREKEFINNSARMIHAFLTGHGYPNPITVKAILKPELGTQEILNLFTFLLSFIGSDLGNGSEMPVKEDIPNALAYIGYPFSIKKSTISAMNTNHNWPTLLAALRWIVELLEAVVGYDTGFDNLFPTDISFSDENYEHLESLKDDMLRTHRMFQYRDEPEILESFDKEREELYEETLGSLREEKEKLMAERSELSRNIAVKEKDTLAVLQSIYNKLSDQFIALEHELTALLASLRAKNEENHKLDEELVELQKQTFEENLKFDRLSTQIEGQELNVAEAIVIKEETKSNRQEIERQRNIISNYNDDLIFFRMQLSKQMGRIRPLMSKVNLAFKEIKFEFQGRHNGLADKLGLDEFISKPEQLSQEIQTNLSILQQLKAMVHGAISKMKQDNLETKSGIQSLVISVHDNELKVLEIEHEIRLQQEMNEELQKKTMDFKKEKTNKKNKLFDELYETRRSCEESNRLVIQLETQRDQIIRSGKEENRRIHEDLNQLVHKVEDIANQTVHLIKVRDEILSQLGEFYQTYKAKYQVD